MIRDSLFSTLSLLARHDTVFSVAEKRNRRTPRVIKVAVKGMIPMATSSALQIFFILVASFSVMGSNSPLRLATARWIMMVVLKNEAEVG